MQGYNLLEIDMNAFYLTPIRISRTHYQNCINGELEYPIKFY